jgi:hypothetical protein
LLQVLVFDDRAWYKHGRDIGFNSCFYRSVTVLRARLTPRSEIVLDVRFNYDGRESRGHFAEWIRFRSLDLSQDREAHSS